MKMIQSSWNQTILPNLDEIGVDLFNFLFKHHDNLTDYFPQVKTSDSTMPNFIFNHSHKFMKIINMFMDNLENLAAITPVLREIGRSILLAKPIAPECILL